MVYQTERESEQHLNSTYPSLYASGVYLKFGTFAADFGLTCVLEELSIKLIS